jgi:hypothetical protein
MKKFKVNNIPYFEKGQIVTEEELREEAHGWIERSWDGTVESFKDKFGKNNWEIIRVKRRFKVVGLGSYWLDKDGLLAPDIKIGYTYKKKSLLFNFKNHLTNWDGSITDLNKKLYSIYGIHNSQIIFEEFYVEVEDK